MGGTKARLLEVHDNGPVLCLRCIYRTYDPGEERPVMSVAGPSFVVVHLSHLPRAGHSLARIFARTPPLSRAWIDLPNIFLSFVLLFCVVVTYCSLISVVPPTPPNIRRRRPKSDPQGRFFKDFPIALSYTNISMLLASNRPIRALKLLRIRLGTCHPAYIWSNR